ncbi:hypothetical protein BWD42_21665 [Sphingobacterium sp. CZ-UAM]|uniref:hypothetical protein n=1 Tax=Sphingobacterium sp. CZ-UAM TaxID=1933868 RepID=UPI000984D6F4|nr:hypothetical protein [Sphingobacterium sp. CZ-UAM]OOG16346.1 hypothetical protein BWD42_21665 [Sphingobacterium sp. CZ-UAM]
MVNRNVINKLSDNELEKYIKPYSRSVADAVQYAYEILKDRGRDFTPAESEQIEALINKKREAEFAEENSWDEGATTDENAIELYKNSAILFFCLFFGVIFGAVLQALNFVKIKDLKGAVFSLLFAVGFALLQIFIIDYTSGNYMDITDGSFYIRIFLSGIGAVGLSLIRALMFPKDLKYRSRSTVVPVVISFLILAAIFIIYIKG